MDPLILNDAGRIIQIETFFTLYPAQENGLRILFGGEVLKKMDEISGILATYYVDTENLVAVHIGEEVLFRKPIETGETGRLIARVVRVTAKIVCVYVRVYGSSTHAPKDFTKRYEGFGLCAVINKKTKAMLQDLDPYSDGTIASDIALEVIELQRSIRRKLGGS